MIQKHRIATNIGRDQKINVEIKQDFDIMEILSLKFTQRDIYASGACANYGVVVGRISANNGFGIPNARVSIFIPQTDLDVNDPVISSLYPYTSTNDKDENGYRYNLLPSRQQHAGHTPTGTFFDQEDILTREEVLQVFETYYSYTVKTNSSGDFMIWGVPVGVQTLHVDIDLSDIGCFSLRPYDFIRKGAGEAEFERLYKFKSSEDIDGLPQIAAFDKSINVYPFWGNESLCEIGISRTDFDLTEKNIKIEPISLILISSFTDDNGDAMKRNGRIKRNSGYKCNLQTTGGKIECVRQTGKQVLGRDNWTHYPELEFYNVTEVIDEAGVAMAVLPMNMEYVFTNQFGEEEVTNDTNKGIPTTAIARFRISLNFNASKLATAQYLVPNIREFNPDPGGRNTIFYDYGGSGHVVSSEYFEGMVASYQFSDVFEDYITPSLPITGMTLNVGSYTTAAKQHKTDLILGTNNNGIPEDYFYKFIFGKVYTISSFHGTHYKSAIAGVTDTRPIRDAFLGIKQIRPTSDEDCASKTNYFPTNFAFKNRVKFSLLLGQVILFVQFIFATILIKFAEVFGKFLWGIGVALYNIGIGRWRPFRRIAERFKDSAYRIQDRFTKTLPLTIYPDCEECSNDDESQIIDSSYANDYCRVAEYKAKVYGYDNRYVYLYGLNTSSSSTYHNTAVDSFLGSDSYGHVNNIFPGNTAKDNEGLCSTSVSPTYGDLDVLHSATPVPPDPGDTNTTRYFAEVYSWRDTSSPYQLSGTSVFSDFIVFLNTPTSEDGSTNRFYDQNVGFLGGNTTFMQFTWEQWDELCGMNYDSIWSNPYRDTALYAVIRIYDRLYKKTTGDTPTDLTIETGCYKYDKTYNEDIVFGYLWSSGVTYTASVPWNPVGLPEEVANFTSYGYDSPGYREYLPGTILPPAPWGANLESTIIGSSSTKRLPLKVAWSKIPNATYDRKTKSGLSEFRNGVFTIIPVISGKSYSLTALLEWYRRKRVGLSFCGGVVNYSFIDNWLNGVLYFFKFNKRIKWDNESGYDLNIRGSKFPRDLIYYHVFDKTFYYRSCPYDSFSQTFFGQSVEEPTFDTVLEILHPTTFYDVGVRDEFLDEICLDPRIDPYCSVVRDITSTSYQDPANVVEYAINYRLDINNGKFDVDDFFSREQLGSNTKVFDGDITQLMSINCEAGIEAFDLDTPHYFMYNGELMDPESPILTTYFKGAGTTYGPTPIDIKLDNNGVFIRSCLNYRLGDYSQVVPFYLWDKKGTGFGSYISDTDQQGWDKTAIASMKLQRLFSISAVGDTTTNYVMGNGEEEYLIKPMTIDHNIFWFYGATADALERFEMISWDVPSLLYAGGAQEMGYAEGDLWLKVISGSIKDPQSGILYAVVDSTWVAQSGSYFDGAYETFVPQTKLNYTGNKQVLSTPFLFYFGLRPEKTALDILIKYFGPKGAFNLSDTLPCFNPNETPTPSSTPNASLLPVPCPPASDPWASPSPTPTPSKSPPHAPAYFEVAPNNMGWTWGESTGSPIGASISTNRNWRLAPYGTSGTSGTSGEMVSVARKDVNESDFVVGYVVNTYLPNWINMQYSSDFGYTWQDVDQAMVYSSQITMIQLYPLSPNTGSSDRSAVIHFSDNSSNYTDYNQSINVNQPAQFGGGTNGTGGTSWTPITFAWVNNTSPYFSLSDQSYTYSAPGLQFFYTPSTYFNGSISVDWFVYRNVNGSPEVLASGTSLGVKYNQPVGVNQSLHPAPIDGDLVYINIGSNGVIQA